ncbi:MAG: hypothetical protein HUU35_11610 [Armatimonadetes bacterium]|nr:hypothetical protein [Armatimonadota bacterium]
MLLLAAIVRVPAMVYLIPVCVLAMLWWCIAGALHASRMRGGYEALITPGALRVLTNQGQVRRPALVEVKGIGRSGIEVTERTESGILVKFRLALKDRRERDYVLAMLAERPPSSLPITHDQQLPEAELPVVRQTVRRSALAWLAVLMTVLVLLNSLSPWAPTTPLVAALRRVVLLGALMLWALLLPWCLSVPLTYGEESGWCWGAPKLRGTELSSFRAQDIASVHQRGWYTYVIGHRYWYVTFGPPGRARRFAAFLAERAGLEEVRLPGP